MRPSSCATLTVLVAALLNGCVADETDGEVEASGGAGGHAAETGGGGDEPGGAASGGRAPTETLADIRLRDGRGDPRVAVSVISNAPDGSLVDEGISDEEGRVALSIPVDGSVSAVYTTTYTYADPASTVATTRYVDTVVFDGLPGDSVELIVGSSASAAPLEQMTVNIAAPAVAGAASYDLSTSCANSFGNATPSKVVQIPNCRPDARFDAVLIARNAAGEILRHATLTNAAFTAGEYQSFDLDWIPTPVGSVEFRIENLPADTEQVSLTSLARQASTNGATWAATTATIDDPGPEVTRVLGHLDSYGNRHCLFAQAILENSDEKTSGVTRQRCSSQPDLSAFVLDAEELARFEPTVESTMPITIAVSETSSGSYGQVLVTSQRWLRNVIDNGYWRVYSKPAPRTLRFPELPDVLAEYAFGADDSFDRTQVGNVVDLEGPESFEAAVAERLPLVNEAFQSVDVGIAP